MAIAPYNYANPQVVAKPSSSGGKVAAFSYPAATPVKPSLTKVVENSAVDAVKQIGGVFKDDASQILDAFKTSFSQGVASVDKINDPKGGTPYEGLQAGLGLAQGVGGVIFSPLAPITNQIGKLITFAGQKLADTPYLQAYGKDMVGVPEEQSQNDTASKILQTLSGGGNVAMSILGAKVGEAKAPVETPEAPVKVPVAHAEPTGNLPLKPIQEPLGTIQMGPKGESTLPTIQMNAPKGTAVKGDLTYEPIKPYDYSKAPAEQAPIGSVASKTAPASVSSLETQQTPTIPRESVGTKTVTKAANDINQTLVKQGFDALPVEEQSKYTPQSFKEVADKVSSLMDTNLDHVKDIASGDEPVPKGINGQILFNAVEALATKEGDGELLTKLASSPLGKKLSEAGQTLGGHGYNDNPHSVIKAIQDIQKARLPKNETPESVVKQYTKPFQASLKKSAVKASLTDFINSIEC